MLKFYVSLLPKQKIAQKIQEKEDQKGICLSLSIHTKLEREEHTKKKKKKNPDQKEHEDLHSPNFRNLAQKL